jgi:hypothetical protein
VPRCCHAGVCVVVPVPPWHACCRRCHALRVGGVASTGAASSAVCWVCWRCVDGVCLSVWHGCLLSCSPLPPPACGTRPPEGAMNMRCASAHLQMLGDVTRERRAHLVFQDPHVAASGVRPRLWCVGWYDVCVCVFVCVCVSLVLWCQTPCVWARCTCVACLARTPASTQHLPHARVLLCSALSVVVLHQARLNAGCKRSSKGQQDAALHHSAPHRTLLLADCILVQLKATVPQAPVQ